MLSKLEKLKKYSECLDFVDYNEILKIFKHIGFRYHLATYIPEGFLIYRARPNEKNDFSSVDEISYLKNPEKYNRANKPHYPIFYGSVSANGRDNPVVTSFAEVCEIIRNRVDDEQEITIGKWLVKEKLPVVSVIFYQEYLNKHSNFTWLYDTYKKRSQNIGSSDLELMEFVSQQFARKIEKNTDYKISAAYAEHVFSNFTRKINALIYPSVQTDGNGFNIALKPSAVKRYLKPIHVYTSKIYFRDGSVINDWLKETEIKDDEKTFELKTSLDPNSNQGKERCLQKLNHFVTNI